LNLGPANAGSASRRPYQMGAAVGTRGGQPESVALEWLVDTGADISVLRKSVGSRFDVMPFAATASPTTGGGGIQVVIGIEAEFEVESSVSGSQTVRAGGPIGIKSNDAASNLLGIEQLVGVGATVAWDPANRSGSIGGP
jgi:hypothetical protein